MAERVWPFDFPAFRRKCKELGFRDYQCWWYAALLASAYLNEERPGYLRNVMGDLYQQAGVTAQLPLRGSLSVEWAAVLRRFVVTDDGAWLTHKRVLKEVSLSSARSKAAQQKLSKTEDLLNAERVYEFVSKKVGKQEALKAIQKAVKNLLLVDTAFWVDREGKQRIADFRGDKEQVILFLAQAAAEFSQSPAGNRGEYTPHPATWFNKGRYFDDRRNWYGVSNGQKQSRQQGGFDAIGSVFAAPDGAATERIHESGDDPGSGEDLQR